MAVSASNLSVIHYRQGDFGGAVREADHALGPDPPGAGNPHRPTGSFGAFARTAFPPPSPMAERRYDDDEIREILARATEISSDTGGLPAHGERSGGGLTLAEIQEAGAEAGIPPARIAEAATSLERGRSGVPDRRPYLGVPIAAAHVVSLPRMMDEDEWDRFVVRLRDTFQATGEVRTEGSLQTWSNGNLKVLLEPLAEGARLRFQSRHDASKQFLDGGVAMAGAGAVLGATLALLATAVGKPVPVGLMGLNLAFLPVGAVLWSVGRAKARAWLPTRQDQFRALGVEALDVVGGAPGPTGPDAD